MPYDFISNPDECSDFWVVKYVEEDFETGDIPPPEKVPNAEELDTIEKADSKADNEKPL